jgi:hypothetical protein
MNWAPRLGALLALLALSFVGGWFVFETFVEMGGVASVRHYLMVLGSITYAVVFWRLGRPSSSS